MNMLDRAAACMSGLEFDYVIAVFSGSTPGEQRLTLGV